MAMPILSIAGLHKSYAVPVLQGVDFSVEPGEVHALVGANGAGKTTLCNIVCGLTSGDSGTMKLSGSPYEPDSIRDAETAGIRFVMQELNLIGNLSVAENLFFKSLPHRRGFVDFECLNDQACDALRTIGLLELDPRTKLYSLGVGQQQLVEIARELIQPCKLLILDEPTAALTDPQTALLFDKLGKLRDQGVGIIYISHRMHEIRQISDRVTVLRDGIAVSNSTTPELSDDEIVRQMAGQPVSEATHGGDVTATSTALRIRGLCTGSLLRDIDLDIRSGEILGIAGLIGSGRTELLRAIFGADRVDAGNIFFGNDESPVLIDSPEDAVSLGIGMIPEDRQQQALLHGQPVAHNLSLASLRRFRTALGTVDKTMEQDSVDELLESLDIDCTGGLQDVDELSGGNQQKVSIGRWLMKDCAVLLFDEPTRGIDIRTKNAIYDLLRRLAASGKAIVVVSSESRELTAICDRIAVLSNGHLAALFERGEWTAEKIMAASFSGYARTDAA